MRLSVLDWAIIAAYFAINVGIGLYYRKRATASTEEFFVSGRNVSWWLAGTSMVATTFAADTPLAVTGLVAAYGIAGNWLWWNMLLSSMLTVFFFARLWRRAGVLTDVEFAELRYAGRPAAFLRGFRALYLGLPINCIILGWVNLAMVKILLIIFPDLSLGWLGIADPKIAALVVVFLIMLLTALISTLSGLWGVLVTDLFQFVLKMGMVIVLGVVRGAGRRRHGRPGEVADGAGRARGGGSILSFTPDVGSAWMPMIAFFVYLAVTWWATWYPGAEPGGGGFVAQRIFCAKDERHSLLATLWFSVAHYAMRPWPWILTALASLVLYPTLADKESGFVKAMADPRVFPGPRRPDDCRLRRRLHVHRGDAAQLGRLLPGERLLPALPCPLGVRAPLRPRCSGGDARRHGRLLGRHLLPGLDRGRVEVPDGHRRGHRQRLHPALVLVAHQRLERSGGDGRLVRRVAVAAVRSRVGQC